jgi:hypothetical protein
MPVPLCVHETMVITYSGLSHFTGTRLMGELHERSVALLSIFHGKMDVLIFHGNSLLLTNAMNETSPDAMFFAAEKLQKKLPKLSC